ncbi:MAG: PAS domain S-box protein [Opitutae bacterium]|nr:PAS domain S-box protein [Opitutae bacterium]
MSAKKAPPAPVAPASPVPAVPPALAALAGTLAGFGDAAVVTRDHWQGGGVEIVLANEKFAALTGYPAAALPGRNTRLLHGPRTDLVVPGAASHDRLAVGEGWLYRKDGTEFFGAWNFSPIFSQGAPSGCLLGIYRDVSEIRRLREALLQSQKLGTVGLLAGGVAHDFNNLLSIINGYCEILATKLTGTPPALKDLQEIHRAGLKAAGLARQILEFSRRQESEVKVVNFNTLVREIAEIIRRVAGAEVAVELRLASDLGNARIDPTHFQRVLLNLCFNAQEAMPRGGKLTIRTWNHRVAADADRRVPEMADGPYAVVQVADTGHGMDEATLRNIFEPYFTTKRQGTGLGLPTVLGIIRENRGHITARSARGAGTTFEIYLPETPEPEETSVTQLDTLPAMRGTETLLIVEEDRVLRKMIAGILSTDGYAVTDATTPAEAAKKVAQGLRPHLVLIQSCTAEGGELIRLLHAANPRLRLVCTSPHLLPVSPHTVPPSATIHLPKPFALSTLVRGVRSLLDAAK